MSQISIELLSNRLLHMKERQARDVDQINEQQKILDSLKDELAALLYNISAIEADIELLKNS